MKKLNKKGFTLTEMIVVIAIIGILAAVLIPSVVIYVNRAKESNDNQLAASMSDEIERYCIESNIDQKNLKASDVRSILVGKGNGSTYNFDNVTITAEAKGDASQSLLSIQYNAMNNTVNFNNCDILVEQLSNCVNGSALEGNKVTFNGEVVK